LRRPVRKRERRSVKKGQFTHVVVHVKIELKNLSQKQKRKQPEQINVQKRTDCRRYCPRGQHNLILDTTSSSFIVHI